MLSGSVCCTHSTMPQPQPATLPTASSCRSGPLIGLTASSESKQTNQYTSFSERGYTPARVPLPQICVISGSLPTRPIQIAAKLHHPSETKMAACARRGRAVRLGLCSAPVAQCVQRQAHHPGSERFHGIQPGQQTTAAVPQERVLQCCAPHLHRAECVHGSSHHSPVPQSNHCRRHSRPRFPRTCVPSRWALALATTARMHSTQTFV
jgi:hypothetical protein